ncbi:hypothetical protein SAMN05519103_00563 [Rhizobiales bacterium GAS113]|nr:hypothetical protein SAMN05519103_00563 [Rhizobiales bacterium GAS113]
MVSHAAYPTPLPMADGVVRVYFSARDTFNRSCITALDLALHGGQFAILTEPDVPLLSPGKRGAFDDSGVTVGCVVPEGDEILVYYLGWSLSVTVPFRNFIGLAIGPRSGGVLRRVSDAPILDRSAVDPYTLGYPWVLREETGWHMWYGSHLCWGAEGLAMRHVIKQARSVDGRCWQRDGKIAIPLAGEAEFAVSRPCVLRDTDCYRMWYARRAPGYSLGYAKSVDGESWVRADHVLALIGPPADWEDETVEYATVFDHGGNRYMLYNGNGYGRTGFGLAILDGSR